MIKFQENAWTGRTEGRTDHITKKRAPKNDLFSVKNTSVFLLT